MGNQQSVQLHNLDHQEEHLAGDCLKTQNQLENLVEINKPTFSPLTQNSAKIAHEMLQSKSVISEKLKPFFEDDSYRLSLQVQVKERAVVDWLDSNPDNSIELHPLEQAGEFFYSATKTINEQNQLEWEEQFHSFGFPSPANLKLQIHKSLELFCQISQHQDSKEQYRLEIPSDQGFKQAFTRVFPNLKRFCTDFVKFDDMKLSNDYPMGRDEIVHGREQFNRLNVQMPMDIETFQKKYPNLWSAYTGISEVTIQVMNLDRSKILIQYRVTKTLITVTCVVSGEHLVWMDNEFSPLTTGQSLVLDRYDFQLNEQSSLMIKINPTLQLVSWIKAVKFPEVRVRADYSFDVEPDDKKIIHPKFEISLDYIEQSNTEWLLSFILPIQEWRNQLMETFQASIRLCEGTGETHLSTIRLSGGIQTPRFPPGLKTLMRFYASDGLVSEGLLIGFKSASGVAKDFVLLDQRAKQDPGDVVV